MNRWKMTEEVREKQTPIVQAFICKVEANHPKNENELLKIDLSDTGLNPYTLQTLLENLGYEETDHESNGWQFDYSITMEKDGFKSLSVNGKGITFELNLSEKELGE